MAPLTAANRLQQVNEELLKSLAATHRLGFGHAQTYQGFFVLSILNVVILDALPMTPSGKLDQRALPSPDSDRAETPDEYVAPRNDLETKLVEIWAEVLMAKRIGVLDNFFDLGGHSLMASQVVARIRKYIGVEILVRSLFEEPTVAALAIAVNKARAEGRTLSVPITPGRREPGRREQLERQLRELSDEEIDALLKNALGERARGI